MVHRILNLTTISKYYFKFSLRYCKTRVLDPDPHCFSKLNSDPHYSKKLDPYLLLLFLDLDSGMDKKQDPGSGINILDPQHCI
jgi:hypothetical protein